jgi:hypothetical protein
MLAQAEALEGLLRAHNSHNPVDFEACFCPERAVRIIPTGDAGLRREQIEAFLQPHFRAFPTGTSRGAASSLQRGDVD